MRDLLAGIEQTIREAQEEGKFDDLEGKGKPLVLDMSPDAVVNGILKEANVVPEWIELGRQVERLREESDRLLESYAVAHAAEKAALTGAGAAVVEPAGERGGPASEPAAARSAARRWFRWRSVAALLSPAPSPPPTTEARREEAVGAFHRRWEAALARYASLLHEINLRQRRFNQIVPFTDRQRAPVPVAERLEAFVERFPRLAWAADDAVRPVRGGVPPALLTPPEDGEERIAKRDLRQAAAIHGMRQMGRRPPPIG